MNQQRRKLLQVILGLFGFGAAKAAAKGEPKNVVASDAKKFEAAIGVVLRGQRVVYAMQHITHDEFNFSLVGGGLGADIAFDAVKAMANTYNAMIFAESNGPDGAQLVSGLMKRCPERVFCSPRCGDNQCSGVLSHQAYRSIPDVRNVLKSINWDTEDHDQAAARGLALFGRNILRQVR